MPNCPCLDGSTVGPKLKFLGPLCEKVELLAHFWVHSGTKVEYLNLIKEREREKDDEFAHLPIFGHSGTKVQFLDQFIFGPTVPKIWVGLGQRSNLRPHTKDLPWKCISLFTIFVYKSLFTLEM